MQGKQDAVGREENQKLNTVAGVLLGVFLLAAWWTLPDYGITYDCHEYFLGDKNLVYLVTREGTHLDYAADSVPIHQRASHLDLHANSVFAAENPQEIWPFGAVVTSISKHGLFGLGLVDDVFDAHHAILPLLVALLGWFVFRFVAREIGPWAGLIAIVCLLSYPRFWAHLHNNYKDIPSAVWFSLVVLSFYHGIEHRRVKQIILAAVLWGAALATKGNALFLPFVVGVWFWYVIYRRVRSSQTGELIVERRAIMALCAFPFIGLAVAALLWPYLMQNFPDHLLLHWDYIRERGATGPDHWQLAAVGKVLSMTPPVMLVLMGCGLACIAFRSGRGRAVSNLDALLLLWLTVPVLRVSVPPVLSVELRATLLDFLDRYPDVKLELIASAVSEDLRAQNIDVAWRATTELAPDLIARKLFKSPVTAVAAPAYLARHGAPRSPADLAAHACLRGFARGIRPTTHWPLTDGGSVRVKGRLVANDLLILYDAALRGDGIALLPETWSGDALADGRLVRVLPDQLGVMAQVALVYPNRRLLKPAVRAFVDFVAPRAAQFSMGPRALR